MFKSLIIKTNCFFLIFSLCSAKDDFTIKEIISAPFPTSLTVSSNGDKVAWVYNESGVRNIFSDLYTKWR